MQDNGLAIAQMGGSHSGDITVSRGRHHNHDDLGRFECFAYLGSDHLEPAKFVSAAFGKLQVDPASFFDRRYVFVSPVEQRNREAHDRQVGSHGFTTITCADNGVVRCH